MPAQVDAGDAPPYELFRELWLADRAPGVRVLAFCCCSMRACIWDNAFRTSSSPERVSASIKSITDRRKLSAVCEGIGFRFLALYTVCTGNSSGVRQQLSRLSEERRTRYSPRFPPRANN